MEREEVIKRLKEGYMRKPKIPSHFYKDYEIIILAITHSWTAIKYIPDKYITKEICEIAVKRYWNAIDYIPEKYKTIELRLEAIKNGGFIAWTDYSEGQNSVEYYKLAVNMDSCVLQLIPEEYITEEMCYITVRQYGMDAIEKKIIPEKYISTTLVKFAKQIDKFFKGPLFVEKDAMFTRIISSMDNNKLKDIIKNINLEELAIAIKYTTEEVREKIYENTGKNKLKILKNTYEYIGPQRLLDVLEAQRRINITLLKN
jgi:hypothetical protein